MSYKKHSVTPNLNLQLSKYNVQLRFNPPYAPHFGGVWEGKVRSVKDGLKVALGNQTCTTDRIGWKRKLNSKPFGYVSTDAKDVDPVTPNALLLGRRDPTLPQVVYFANELPGRRR